MPGIDTATFFHRITVDLIAYVLFAIGGLGLLVVIVEAIRKNDQRVINEQRDTINALYREITASRGERDE